MKYSMVFLFGLAAIARAATEEVVVTITSCAPEVTDCPAKSSKVDVPASTPVYTPAAVSTISVETIVCPGNGAPAATAPANAGNGDSGSAVTDSPVPGATAPAEEFTGGASASKIGAGLMIAAFVAALL